MALTSKLRWFSPGEFHHAELVNDRAAQLLDQLRGLYGKPLVITDDARLPGAVRLGGSTTSLHYLGQAFDLRTRELTEQEYWKLVGAVYTLATQLSPQESGVELECAVGAQEHLHFGLFLDGRPSRFFVRAT